jgi:hypothetical protein
VPSFAGLGIDVLVDVRAKYVEQLVRTKTFGDGVHLLVYERAA